MYSMPDRKANRKKHLTVKVPERGLTYVGVCPSAHLQGQTQKKEEPRESRPALMTTVLAFPYEVVNLVLTNGFVVTHKSII